ncbi:aspartate aminotransferase family protein [Bacteroidota bacterium]
MISERQLFLQHIAQTSENPLLLDIDKGEGIFLFDKSGKKYIDLISGIAVSNLGHSNPQVIKAIFEQIKKYSHIMVYGEYIQSPQVKLAELLTNHLPSNLNSVYFVNSGSEATEGALKLAKKYTQRNQIISFKNAYHGSTHGALSVMGEEKMKRPFRPLLPGVKFIDFNSAEQLKFITDKTAAVIVEPIQGEAGIILPENDFLLKIKERCKKSNTLLIFDEAQTGLGRTGRLFAFEHYNVIPDILLLAKALGGGMPLGAFISSKKIMNTLSYEPVLGHITTFGGHPVSCAAAYASLDVVLKEELIQSIPEKEKLFRKYLKHPRIKKIKGKGLFLAIELDSSDNLHKTIKLAINKGIIIDWFLFNQTSIRIAPPLIINEKQIIEVCNTLISCLNEI